MALKLKIPKLDDVPEAVRALYKQQGSEFHLDLDGADELSRLNEFRTNNTQLAKDLADERARLKSYEGLDPAMVATMREQIEATKAAEEKELLKKGNFNEVVNRRTAAAGLENERKINAANETLASRDKTINSLKGRLAELLVDTDIQRTIEAVGLKPRTGAMADITRRGRDSWQVNEDGTLTPIERGTKNVMYSKEKTGQPMPMKEYVTGVLATEAAHLFEAAGGGGAGGGRAAGGGGVQGGGASRVLINPDAATFGKHAKEIQAGTVTVEYR